MYKLSISASKSWFIIFLFSFKVGVRVFESTDSSTGITLNLMILWAREIAFSFAFYIPSDIIALSFSHFMACSIVVASHPL